MGEVEYYTAHFDRGVEWYVGTFSGSGKRIDTSPKYFMRGHVAAPRIQAAIGHDDPLFVLILRNPIDYLNSHFRMQLSQCHFEKHPKEYPKLTSNLLDFVDMYPKYLERGFYHKILKKCWLSHFSPTQFKIVIFEEFTRSPEVVKGILTFWGLSPAGLTAETVSQNRLLRSSPMLYRMQSFVISHKKLKKRLMSSKIVNFLYKHLLTVSSGEMLSHDDRLRLAEHFLSDVGELKRLLGRDIPQWKDFSAQQNRGSAPSRA
jgi:hypothetical protein